MFERYDNVPANDPALFAPTKCKVVGSFCIKGRQAELGSVVVLPRFDAESLAATRKVEFV